MITQTRPIHLDLTKMKFPPMAIVSIMHRISGVILFLLLPFVLYFLEYSLSSKTDFTALQQSLLLSFPMKILLWSFIAALCFHFLAGIRHMLMDCGLAESLIAAKRSAYLILLLEIIAVIIVGVWLW